MVFKFLSNLYLADFCQNLNKNLSFSCSRMDEIYFLILKKSVHQVYTDLHIHFGLSCTGCVSIGCLPGLVLIIVVYEYEHRESYIHSFFYKQLEHPMGLKVLRNPEMLRVAIGISQNEAQSCYEIVNKYFFRIEGSRLLNVRLI